MTALDAMERVVRVGRQPTDIAPQWNAADRCVKGVHRHRAEIIESSNHLRKGIAGRIHCDHLIPVRDRLVVPPQRA